MGFGDGTHACFFVGVVLADRLPVPTSLIMMPRIQILTAKNTKDASHRPGTNVEWPRNSSW